MSLTLKLAWRSFLRHRRRSVITAAAISLGLAMMLVFVGLSEDSHRRMADMGVRMGAGHVVVQGAGYQEQQTLDQIVSEPAAVMARARAIEGVGLVAPRLHASGLLSTGESSAAVALVGVDPDVEPRASTIAAPRKRVRGHYLRSRSELDFANQPGDIYVGAELAETLELELEDRVVLTVSPRGGGRPQAAAFTVRGVFRTGVNELDAFYVEIALDEATDLLDTGGGVTQVAIIADDLQQTERIAGELREALSDRDDLEVLTWKVVLAELYEGILLDDISLYMLMAIIFVIVALGIFNTVLMSVVERTRELGVMMAIGTSGPRVFAVVVAESMVLAVMSVTIGLAIGLSIHAWLASTGLDLTSLYGDMEFAGMVFEGRIYSHLTAATVVKWTLVVAAVVVASAIYPAIRAARLEPVEAMRHA